MKGDTEGKTLAYYLDLHYPVTLHADPDGGYVAEIEELAGCMTQAETVDEAFRAIEEARQLWVETAYHEGQDIPMPRAMEQYPGKFLVRIPKSLHRSLARAAKREGVSLNQYVTSLLSSGVYGGGIAEQLSNMLATVPLEVWFPAEPFGDQQMPRRRDEIVVLAHGQFAGG